MPHSRLYYHIIWGTKNRESTITPKIEPLLFDFIRSKAIGLGGYVYALNGIENHVHLVAHIPRTIPVSQYVGKIKGSSSTRLNKSGEGDGQFYWQSEYSIFTISEFIVPKLIKYVENQRHHHSLGSIKPWFEMKK
ncbi:MAG: IS200/IS605 family transposase [Anaerolineales bacterium]